MDFRLKALSNDQGSNQPSFSSPETHTDSILAHVLNFCFHLLSLWLHFFCFTSISALMWRNSPCDARATPSVFIHGKCSFTWVGERRETLAPASLQHKVKTLYARTQSQLNIHGYMMLGGGHSPKCPMTVLKITTECRLGVKLWTSGFCSSPPWCEPCPHWPRTDILTGWTVGQRVLHSTHQGVP